MILNQEVRWARRDSRIVNPDGSVVFEMTDAEAPADWSQVAVDIIVSKHFRKAGVPQAAEDGSPLVHRDGSPVLGAERSVRAVFDRLAKTWHHWGQSSGYFDTEADADAFCDEIKYMPARQIAAPNSPQWLTPACACMLAKHNFGRPRQRPERERSGGGGSGGDRSGDGRPRCFRHRLFRHHSKQWAISSNRREMRRML